MGCDGLVSRVWACPRGGLGRHLGSQNHNIVISNHVLVICVRSVRWDGRTLCVGVSRARAREPCHCRTIAADLTYGQITRM